jgi:hypothetical protein
VHGNDRSNYENNLTTYIGLIFTLPPQGNISEAHTELGELKLGVVLGMLQPL